MCLSDMDDGQRDGISTVKTNTHSLNDVMSRENDDENDNNKIFTLKIVVWLPSWTHIPQFLFSEQTDLKSPRRRQQSRRGEQLADTICRLVNQLPFCVDSQQRPESSGSLADLYRELR